jgi:hypothetical protein
MEENPRSGNPIGELVGRARPRPKNEKGKSPRRKQENKKGRRNVEKRVGSIKGGGAPPARKPFFFF